MLEDCSYEVTCGAGVRLAAEAAVRLVAPKTCFETASVMVLLGSQSSFTKNTAVLIAAAAECITLLYLPSRGTALYAPWTTPASTAAATADAALLSISAQMSGVNVWSRADVLLWRCSANSLSRSMP